MSYGTISVRMVPASDGDAWGHMWVVLNGPGAAGSSFGFYPASGFVNPVGTAGEVFTGDEEKYAAPKYADKIQTASFAVDEAQFRAALEFCQACLPSNLGGQGAYGEYIMPAKVCIDFAWDVVKQAGIAVFQNGGPGAGVDSDGRLLTGWNQQMMQDVSAAYAASANSYSLIPRNDVDPLPLIDEYVRGGAVGDSLSGGLGADKLWGFAGDDVLDGGQGNDILYGGKGNDILNGGLNDDTYIHQSGDGNDTIYTGGGSDVLKLNGAATFSRDGIDVLANLSSGETVRIKDWFTAGTTDNQLAAAVVNGQQLIGQAISNLALEVHGGASADYLTGLAGYSDVIYGGGGNDNIYLAQPGSPNASDTAYGGAGNDWIWGGDSNDFLYGGADNDNLLGGGGANVYGWSAGDGMDNIYSTSTTDTLEFGDLAGITTLTAAKSGNDLLVSAGGTGGGGAVIKNWFLGLGYGKVDITLPDGTTWTPEQIEAGFKPAVMGVDFPSGVASANDFVGIVRNQGWEFAGGDNYLSSAFGFSWLGYVWQQGLQYAASTGNTVNGHAVREWGSSMGYTNNAYAYTDPNYSVWSEFTYQFWETDNGSYAFSLVKESAGTGGQTYNYRDTDGDGWTDTWDVVTKSTWLNRSWTPTPYEVSPAVTQVDLLAGPSSGAAARSASIATPDELSAEMATAVYAKPVAVPEFLASPFEDQLFASEQESSDVLAYLVHTPGRSVAVAAELGDPSTFFGLAEDSGDGLAAYQRDISLQVAVTDDASTDEAAYRDAQMVPVYISGPNDFRLAA